MMEKSSYKPQLGFLFQQMVDKSSCDGQVFIQATARFSFSFFFFFFLKHLVCLSSMVCMVGVVFVYIDMVYGFLRVFFFMLGWMFQHDFLDTYCFGCLMCMCFVFASVPRN